MVLVQHGLVAISYLQNLSSNPRLLTKLIFLSVYFYGAHGGVARAIMALVLTLMLLVLVDSNFSSEKYRPQ